MSEICTLLHHLANENKLERFVFPFDVAQIPRNGIYILFEAGEHAHETDRIVRVGTHTGNNQLRARLQQHFVTENKDRSIFRKNIGRAFLNRTKDPFLEQWNWDLTTRKAKDAYGNLLNRDYQQEMERRVTEYIQDKFSFVVLEIVDKAERLKFESRIISTVSLCKGCHPSAEWLGLHSPKAKIRQSGLWLVNELYKEPLSEQEFVVLREIASKPSS